MLTLLTLLSFRNTLLLTGKLVQYAPIMPYASNISKPRGTTLHECEILFTKTLTCLKLYILKISLLSERSILYIVSFSMGGLHGFRSNDIRWCPVGKTGKVATQIVNLS